LYRSILIPAYLLANLISLSLWRWRIQRRAHDSQGNLLSIKTRLRELQSHFHHYTFTYFPDQPGGDPRGLLYFPEEENRLEKNYIQKVRQEYDETLRKLLDDNPESQFR